VTIIVNVIKDLATKLDPFCTEGDLERNVPRWTPVFFLTIPKASIRSFSSPWTSSRPVRTVQKPMLALGPPSVE
jgi:hypothetical protein